MQEWKISKAIQSTLFIRLKNIKYNIMSWVSRHERKLTWPICKFSFSNMDSHVWFYNGFSFCFVLPEGSWIPKDKWTVILYSRTSKTMELSFVSITYAPIIIVLRKVLGFLTLWCWETWVGKWRRACLINESLVIYTVRFQKKPAKKYEFFFWWLFFGFGLNSGYWSSKYSTWF